MRWLALVTIFASCAHVSHIDPRCASGTPVVDDTLDRAVGVVRDRTVATVDIEGAGPALAETLRRVIATHPGDSLVHGTLADDIHRLWALGVLSDIRVEVAASTLGADVTFAVKPRPLVDRVFAPGDLEVRRLRWLVGTPFEPARIVRMAAGAQSAYIHDGYLDASVSVTQVALPGVGLCVAATRGPRVTIRELRFPGRHAIPEAELVSAIRGAKAGINHPRGIYDATGLDEDRAVFIVPAYEHGLLDATFDPPRAVRHGDRVDLEVEVHEGEPYHLGRVTVLAVGASKIPLGLAPGDLFVRSRGVEAMERFARALGESADVMIPEVSYDHEHHLANVTFEFRWRQPWRVLRLLSPH